jgi:hypothetical protein
MGRNHHKALGEWETIIHPRAGGSSSSRSRAASGCGRARA